MAKNTYNEPMDKDNGEGRIKYGEWEWVGRGRVMEKTWRQL